MKPVEIERKYLIRRLPENLSQYQCKKIAQGYICTNPVVRIRKSDDEYYLTYKGKGLMAREEYNLPLTQEGYEHMLPKIDGRLIEKSRYLIPLDGKLTAELDIFEGENISIYIDYDIKIMDMFTGRNVINIEITEK